MTKLYPHLFVIIAISIMLAALEHTILSFPSIKTGITESVSSLYTSNVVTKTQPTRIVPKGVEYTKSNNPYNRTLIDFVSSHWNIPASKAATVVKAAFKYGEYYKVPPLFILAEIATESSFRTKVFSDASAVGIMQVYPKEHWTYILKHHYTGNGYSRLFHTVPNIKFGAYILSRYYHVYGNVNQAAAHYFGICSFDKTYIQRVDTNMNSLEQHV